MRQQSANPDAIIAQTAERQHGVVSIEQLIEAGISASGVSRRVAAGRLHRVHRGVYAVGHRALSNEGRWMAAVVACGEGAVLSHISAAGLWRILPSIHGTIDVTVRGPGGRPRRPGLRVHRPRSLPDTEIVVLDGIRVSSVARTLADLRRVAAESQVRSAVRAAEQRGLPVGDRSGDRTRSELERRFLRLCRRHRLPLPEVNVRVGPHVVDFLWRAARLIVETDGYAYHRGRAAFDSDRRRQNELVGRGYRVLRFTYDQITRNARSVAETVRGQLR